MSEDRSSLIDDVRSLLAARPEDVPLGHAEETLTAGYAHALALEAEQARLERRMEELAHEGDAHELLGLARRASMARRDLIHLRTLLSALRDRTRELRTAS